MAQHEIPKLESNTKLDQNRAGRVKPVEGTIAVKKKSAASKVKSEMIAEDLEEVKQYLIWDILIPTVKDTIVSLIKNGAEALFYGSSSTRRRDQADRRPTASYSGYYYGNSYRNRQREKRPERQLDDWRRSKRGRYDLSQIVFTGIDGRGGLDAKRQAEEVLDQLVELTMSYGFARVADFYELAGYPTDYTDNSLGWGERSEARIARVNGGYVIDLPEPEPIG